MNCPLCKRCFDTAIEAETAMNGYYQTIIKLFPNEDFIIGILYNLALDEKMHANGLSKAMNSKIHSEHVHAEAEKLIKILKEITRNIKKAISKIPAHFGEVYDFIHEQEDSEINKTFIFLMSETLAHQQKKEIIQSNINEHIEKVFRLASFYDREQRQHILPVQTA